jgi:Ca2+-transporting ATPase
MYQLTGLSQSEVKKRQLEEGENIISRLDHHSSGQIMVEVLREPMLFLLLIIVLIYFLLGNPDQAGMLSIFVLLVIGITFWQERKTARALESLRNLASPRALVIRSGKRKRLSGTEVVRGDILLLSEGSRIAADAVIKEETNLLVDESLITGESVPVNKKTSDKIFAGSIVIAGSAMAEVTAIGKKSEIGKIGLSLQEISKRDSRLQTETRHLVKSFAEFGLSVSLIIFLLFGLLEGQWLAGLLAGLALGMAILPEEFPVITSVFLAIGSWRMSKKSVLVRDPASIEALGTVTTLCVDKTGTLTLNKLKVEYLIIKNTAYQYKEILKIPKAQLKLWSKIAYFSCRLLKTDPIEAAIEEYVEQIEPDLKKEGKLLKEYELATNNMVRVQVWQQAGEEELLVTAVGAPESVADLCKVQPELAQLDQLAEVGVRLIGLGFGSFPKGKPLPSTIQDFKLEYLGMVGLKDQVRPEVKSSLERCYQAGIRVIMLTGDHPGTAVSVAREIGLANPEFFLTGDQLNSVNKHQLKEKLKNYNIFARILPEQKLKLIQLLQSNGEVVAMTGDGVNDAPALRAADIGIAMGERGTDVAREAADMILLHDDFPALIEAVALGRRIFTNIRQAFSYVLAVHVPIIGLAFAPLLFGWPLILFPAQIALLEMIIDPSCSVVFEAEDAEAGSMQQKPRSVSDSVLDQKRLWLSVMQGLIVLVVLLFLHQWAMYLGVSDSMVRSLTFIPFIFAALGLVIANSLRFPKLVWLLFLLGLFFIFLIYTWPLIANLFSLSPVPIWLLVIFSLFGFGSPFISKHFA